MKEFSKSLLWLAIVILPVQAQTGIDTLVVTGERVSVPVAGAQITAIDQQQPGTRADAAELLQGINGLQADSRSNYAQDTRITLRGFGARSAFGVRGVDLQIDGIPLTMPDGQGQFSGALLDGVTQVIVLTGPVAALYGNAAGGVINLQTSAPETNRVAVATSADEDGLARHQLLGEFHGEDLGLRIQASRLDADGNRPHASAEREQLGAQLYYQFDNGIQAQWRFDKERAPLLQDPLGLTPAQWADNPYQLNSSAEFFNTRKTIDHQQNSISLREQDGDQRWQVAVWQGERDIQQYLAQKGDALANSGGVVDLHRTFSGGNGNYTWDFALAGQATSFTLGAEWAEMNDRRKGYVNLNGIAGDLRRNELGQADNRDVYALLQGHFSDAWEWLAGVRQSQLNFSVADYFILAGSNADDSGERRFTRTAESLATRYTFNPAWSLHAAIGNGFETPTLTEMAYTNSDRGFNQTLDAASNQQQEIGVDYRRSALAISLTVFAVETKNELVVDQSVNGRTTYRNAAATERKGVELHSEYRLNETWDTRIALNYLDATYTRGQYQSLQLPGVARVNHYAQLNWHPWQNDLVTLGLSLVHRSEIAANDNNQIRAPAYDTVDVSASGNIHLAAHAAKALSAQWWLKLANVTDENYVGSVIVNQTNGRAFEPASGRNLAAGIRLGFEY